MKSFTSIIVLSLLAAVNASVLSTTDIAKVLDGATSQKTLTVPADARAAIAKLGAGGVNAATLSAADKAAISACSKAAAANNNASKANLGGGTGSAGNIVFVANKITLHACEAAGQQINLAAGKQSSDATINLVISNVGVLNANTKKAGIAKREVQFSA